MVPGRIQHEQAFPRLPEYRVLVDASRRIKSMGQPMRAIRTKFDLPLTADPEFLYRVLGGRIDRESRWVAVIWPDGRVSYEQVEG
jgi:hypothetical protein